MGALNTTDRDRLAADIPAPVALAPGEYLARRWRCIRSTDNCSGYVYSDNLVPGNTPRCDAVRISGNGQASTLKVCNSVMMNDGVYVLKEG